MPVKPLTLEDIYWFFKAAAQTSIASDAEPMTFVDVSWEYSPGFLRWYLVDGQIRMKYLAEDPGPFPELDALSLP